MKEPNIGVMLAVAVMVAGCATHPAPPMANSRETLSLVITPGPTAQEYTVQATMATVCSSETLPPSLVASTNALDFLQGSGHADVLSAPHATVVAGQWAEIRVCSTNTSGTFSVSTRIGEESVSVAHPAGLVFRVKVEPTKARLVRVQGLLSLGSEDASGNMHYHRVAPFLADCELATPTVVFQKEHVIPSTSSPYELTEKWETTEGTTNTCTLPSRNRAGK